MLRDVPFSPRGTDLDAIFMSGGGVSPPPETAAAPPHLDPLDDVFGSAPNSPALRPSDGVDGVDGAMRRAGTELSDVPRLRSTHVTNGYREGIAASKETHIQAGFDEGYSLGAEIGLKAGAILGALEGFWFAVRARETKSKKSLVSGAGSEMGELGELVERDDVGRLLMQAEEELGVSALFGKEYFGPDGIWIFDVPGQEEESETTFEIVAEAHPVLRKWRAELLALAGKLGLRLE